MDSNPSSKFRGDQGGDHTGQQRRIIHDPYADHLHGENCRRHRCLKHSSEGCTHAAHDHDVAVFPVQTEPSSQLVAYASSKLDSSALSSG